MSLITVCIPFFNGEKYLSQAIESVLNQTYKELELLLIDDGSTDSSLDIAYHYKNIDPRVSVYSDGFNKNLGYRLNQVPTLVKTKFLVRMDADDVMHPDKIRRQFEVLESNPEIDVLGTNAYVIDENSIVFGQRLKNSRNEMVKVSSFIHPTIMARTEWFLNNPYDVDAVRMEDAELWYRCENKYNFYILTEPLFFYREFGYDYYKKYFATYKSRDYILKKYNDKFWINYFNKLLIKSWAYRIFNILRVEKVLIKRRNEVIFHKKRKINDVLKDVL